MINLEELTYNYFLGDTICILSVYVIFYTPCMEGPTCNLLCVSSPSCEGSVTHYVHGRCTSRRKKFRWGDRTTLHGAIVKWGATISSSGPPSTNEAKLSKDLIFYLFHIKSQNWPHTLTSWVRVGHSIRWWLSIRKSCHVARDLPPKFFSNTMDGTIVHQFSSSRLILQYDGHISNYSFN